MALLLTAMSKALRVRSIPLILLGLSTFGLRACTAQTTESCSAMSLSAEDEEGPYYLNDELFRSNITETESGIPMNFFVSVVDTSCSPVADAYVDIWHCNATGYYSGYLDSESTASTPGTGASGTSAQIAMPPSSMGAGDAAAGPQPGASGASASGPTAAAVGASSSSMSASASSSTTSNDNTTFLRGIVPTNASGVSTFQTIFPGWYSGRATHVHAKIHVPLATSASEATEFNNSHVVHTAQVFFNDTLTNSIFYNIAPYTEKNASSSDHVLTVNDDVFLDQADSNLAQVATVEEVVAGSITDGLNVYITFKVDSSSTPAAVGVTTNT